MTATTTTLCMSREAVFPLSAHRHRSYRCVQKPLSSSVTFTTDSEEKHHGNTCQEVSREVSKDR